MGPLWLDVAGYELTAEDKEILQHPTVGGVILFSRNYFDSQQLIALNKAIRQAAKRPILIGTDQEGGRVQRFREGFSSIPAAQEYGRHKDSEELAYLGGWLMAAEVIAHDIDISFAPVLDKGHQSKAIGSRAFSENVQDVIALSQAYMRGMKELGMITTGKHFPGHGGVEVDSHAETPYDHRTDIFAQDMAIFRSHIEQGLLDAMMPAHVVYPHFDDRPASGSSYWLKDVLRDQLGFKGIVFSDDLNMEGASIMGGPAERAQQSLDAGCDMVLMCNNRDAQVKVLDGLPISEFEHGKSMLKKQNISLSDLRLSKQWKHASEAMARLCDK
ncbi:beta-N-acetylhexosaminidase [Vibrio marisflavi]|uniref:Beta-hexosaminidase n=1 Tax=Vibrio marisflavi CECT 7928 TaxID=634439 RepID=A0ABN8E6S4_9VIBR|nr:beta-N-acetylhexosaminidase [Vibrio marisflavi]CAH0541115.1 Beta-hexosaminidase [Vibrio marisflavi CECT 7928]